MSTRAERHIPPSYYEAPEERGSGWVMFAGVLLVLIGTMNVIDGIAAISSSRFYVANAHYVFGDLKTWGWIAVPDDAGVSVLVGVDHRDRHPRHLRAGRLRTSNRAGLAARARHPDWVTTSRPDGAIVP